MITYYLLYEPKDRSLEALLGLNGDTYVIDEAGHWVKFVVSRVPASPQRPHGIQYSLTLHGLNNERILGFDNSHSVKKGHRPDHRHLGKAVRPYVYKNAEQLLTDFWQAVDAFLKTRG